MVSCRFGETEGFNIVGGTPNTFFVVFLREQLHQQMMQEMISGHKGPSNISGSALHFTAFMPQLSLISAPRMDPKFFKSSCLWTQEISRWETMFLIFILVINLELDNLSCWALCVFLNMEMIIPPL